MAENGLPAVLRKVGKKRTTEARIHGYTKEANASKRSNSLRLANDM